MALDKELIEGVSSVASLVLIGILSYFAKNIKSKTLSYIETRKKHKSNKQDFLTKNIDISTQFNIRQLLARLLQSLGSDRCNVFYWVSNNNDKQPQQPTVFSMNFEVLQDGVSVEQQNFQNIDISNYPYFNKLLTNAINDDNKDQPFVICVNKLDDSLLKSTFLKIHCYCSIVKLIRINNKSLNYGFLMIGFSSTQCDKNNGSCVLQSEHHLEHINEIVSRIEYELTVANLAGVKC